MRLATKSQSEWEDEQVEAVHGKPMPRKKPPRHDLRNHRTKKEYDDRNGDKDLQPMRKSAEHSPGDVWKTSEGKWRAKNPKGNTESFEDQADAKAYAKGEIEDIDEEDVTEVVEDEDDEDSSEDLEEDEAGPEDDEPSKPGSSGRDALRQAERVIQSLLTEKTALPKDTQESLASALEYMPGKDRAVFLRKLRKSLQYYIGKNGFDNIARKAVNSVATIEDFSVFTDPKDLAKKVALLAYGANVVANPKILAGLPVSRQPKTTEQLTRRSEEAYRHFRNLAKPWRVHAAKEIEKELRQDPKGPRAKELEAILTGISVAHIIESGEGLPGRPEPSHGAVELFRKMAEDGQEQLLFKPSEDFFAPENRTILRSAISRVPSKEVSRLLIGDDDDHPYRKLTEILGNTRIPGPLRTAVRTFMEEEALMSMTWKDRAFRDAMGTTQRGHLSPKERFEEMQSAQDVPPELASFLEGVEKAAQGDALDPKQAEILQAAEQSKGQSLLRAGAAKFMGWLRGAFSGKGDNPAAAVLGKYVETGDPEWLERPVRPHPDQKREKRASFSPYRVGRYRRHPATPERSTMRNVRITKRAANLVVGQLERAANLIQKNHKQLGLDVKIAYDFARRADLLSDFIDRKAGINRQAMQRQAQGPAATISYDFENFTETDLSDLDFDPSEIGEMSEGALMRDPDEPYMDVFNQDEYFQLGEVQEQGMFSNARVANRRRK